jgi:hypothetical protein
LDKELGKKIGFFSQGTRPCVALSARALFQELGVVMAAWHHSASAVRYPRLGLDCTMGQLAVIMGELDDVVVGGVATTTLRERRKA